MGSPLSEFYGGYLERAAGWFGGSPSLEQLVNHQWGGRYENPNPYMTLGIRDRARALAAQLGLTAEDADRAAVWQAQAHFNSFGQFTTEATAQATWEDDIYRWIFRTAGRPYDGLTVEQRAQAGAAAQAVQDNFKAQDEASEFGVGDLVKIVGVAALAYFGMPYISSALSGAAAVEAGAAVALEAGVGAGALDIAAISAVDYAGISGVHALSAAPWASGAVSGYTAAEIANISAVDYAGVSGANALSAAPWSASGGLTAKEIADIATVDYQGISGPNALSAAPWSAPTLPGGSTVIEKVLTGAKGLGVSALGAVKALLSGSDAPAQQAAGAGQVAGGSPMPMLLIAAAVAFALSR